MDERLIQELPVKSKVSLTDYTLVEDEDGTKLAQVSSLKQILTSNLMFNTIEDLKSATLKEGEICMTLGYHEINDGGGATYYIAYEPTAVEDNGLVHYLYTSDTLRAKLVVYDYIIPEQFGAYGDGTHDDSTIINKCIDTGYAVKFNAGHVYRINSPIQLKSDMYLDFDGAKIKPTYCDMFSKKADLTDTNPLINVIIKGFHADLSKASNGFNITHPVRNMEVSDFVMYGLSSYGFKLPACDHIHIHDGHIVGGDTGSQIGVGVVNQLSNTFKGIYPYAHISIDHIRFEKLYPAISVNIQDIPVVSSIKNCTYIAFSNMVYATFVSLYGSPNYATIDECVAVNPIDILKMNSIGSIVDIGNVHIIYGDASESEIAPAAIVYSYCAISNTSPSSTINLNGDITVTNNKFEISPSNPIGIMDSIYGTLKLIGNINLPAGFVWFTQNSISRFPGSVIDSHEPKSYPLEVYTTAEIPNTTMQNRYVDAQASQITNIQPGINGQRIYLISSTGATVVRGNNINIVENSVVLSKTSGIELKYDGSKWTQI